MSDSTLSDFVTPSGIPAKQRQCLRRSNHRVLALHDGDPIFIPFVRRSRSSTRTILHGDHFGLRVISYELELSHGHDCAPIRWAGSYPGCVG